MLIQIGILIVGLALVVFGADWLVDGASSVARRSGISEFVIGLTIVGFGTSCPELVVSLTGAIAGNSDISIGNVIGSNIFNTLLILGLTAVILPVSVTRANKLRDIPITFAVTVLLICAGLSYTLFGLGSSDGLSRVEGIVFLIVFALYIYSCFKFDEKSAQEEEKPAKEIKTGMAIALILAGIAGLIFGGRLFVRSATEIARMIGVSDKFIAITVLAGGTSLPELATCIVAAAKKRGQLALGNILGSNVFNILLILGCSAVVRPISFADIDFVDVGVMLLSVALVWIAAAVTRPSRIRRFDGAVLLLTFAAYYVWLFLNI